MALMRFQEYALLKAKLDWINEELPKVSKAIGIAADEGDLSENAEYHGQREKQGLLMAEKEVLEGKLNNAQVVNLKARTGKLYDTSEDNPEKTALFGSTLTLVNLNGEIKKITLTGRDEITNLSMNPILNEYLTEDQIEQLIAMEPYVVAADFLDRPNFDEVIVIAQTRNGNEIREQYRIIGISYKEDMLFTYLSQIDKNIAKTLEKSVKEQLKNYTGKKNPRKSTRRRR